MPASTAKTPTAITKRFHLAQFNVAKLRYPRSAAIMADYEEALARVLPIALARPGFIWIMDDEIIGLAEAHFGQGFAANLSLWSDLESLRSFMACPPHAAAMGRRDEWFVPIAAATFVIWWVPCEQQPDFAEACRRLSDLRKNGPSPEAFTLEQPFPTPE